QNRKDPALEPENAALLQTLTADPSNKVRLEAYFCLLSNRQPIDLNGFIATLNSFPERRANDYRIVRFLRSNYQQLGPEFAALLPFLEASRMDDSEMQKVQKHFAGAQKTQADKFAFAVRRPAAKPVLATYAKKGANGEPASPAAAAIETARIPAVFFYTPGCPDCERAEKTLADLKTRFPRLEIERQNLRTVEAMRLNEALCERFHVPAVLRSVGPALFASEGCLVKTELTPEKMAGILAQSAGLPDDWRKLPETELTQAGAAIGNRYTGFSVSVVLLAGLLDGVNPCAFATLIFFISYLQVARRSPAQILQVGGAFIAGVFLAYFILGLGLVEIVGRLAVLRGAGRILNGALGLFALGIMAISIRDGILCLRGRMEESTLQLPAFLKTRIHNIIRTGTRHRRFVIAAFLSGIVISFLELACTGQVYAPTILYMLKSGRAAAVIYLGVYNLAFILPLIGVFALAYAGVRSEALIRIQKRHAALIKFATAALFLLLFLVLVREL
ncbi:MAG: hypothetical protein PHQ12_03845, partial [Chthoniobacteraceae bacterium]|nr:hypothetical protein [Chthoniobacteraceae bacterium]